MPTGRQTRTWASAYLASVAVTTPSPRLASISTCGSPEASAAPLTGPTYMAACDQVDCVRYLMTEETWLLPSTRMMSAGRSEKASASGSGGVAG